MCWYVSARPLVQVVVPKNHKDDRFDKIHFHMSWERRQPLSDCVKTRHGISRCSSYFQRILL